MAFSVIKMFARERYLNPEPGDYKPALDVALGEVLRYNWEVVLTCIDANCRGTMRGSSVWLSTRTKEVESDPPQGLPGVIFVTTENREYACPRCGLIMAVSRERVNPGEDPGTPVLRSLRRREAETVR